MPILTNVPPPVPRKCITPVTSWFDSILVGNYVDSSDYVRALLKVVHSVAQLGGVVMVGRGANFIVGPESMPVRFTPTVQQPTFAVRTPVLRIKPGTVLVSKTHHGPYYTEQGGAFPGACLRYQRLLATRTYVVEATSAGTHETGAFTLSVARPSPPNGAGSLAQFRNDGTTPIPVGGGTDQSTVVLRGILSDPDAADTLRLEVEVRPLGTAFSDVATATSDPVANGAAAFVSATALANNTAYHWQARTLDQTSRASAWAPFGANLETAADFSTSIPADPLAPAGLGQFQSNGSTPIAVGGTASGRSVVFRATVSDPNPGDQLRLEVEVQPVDTSFTGAVRGSSPSRTDRPRPR